MVYDFQKRMKKKIYQKFSGANIMQSKCFAFFSSSSSSVRSVKKIYSKGFERQWNRVSISLYLCILPTSSLCKTGVNRINSLWIFFSLFFPFKLVNAYSVIWMHLPEMIKRLNNSFAWDVRGGEKKKKLFFRVQSHF